MFATIELSQSPKENPIYLHEQLLLPKIKQERGQTLHLFIGKLNRVNSAAIYHFSLVFALFAPYSPKPRKVLRLK